MQSCGWQFQRTDLDKGLAMVFRRQRSPYSLAQVALHGLDSRAKYAVNFRDTVCAEVLTGAQLQAWQAAIDTPAKSLLIVYERKRD